MQKHNPALQGSGVQKEMSMPAGIANPASPYMSSQMEGEMSYTLNQARLANNTDPKRMIIQT